MTTLRQLLNSPEGDLFFESLWEVGAFRPIVEPQQPDTEPVAFGDRTILSIEHTVEADTVDSVIGDGPGYKIASVDFVENKVSWVHDDPTTPVV